MAKSIAVITTSTRTPRVGTKVSELVLSILNPIVAAKHSSSSSSSSSESVTLHHVQVADFNLPVFDEALAPARVFNPQEEYTHEHTKKWSAEIARHDGYILAVPEYNYGMAGSTKNAIDYLANEWKGKPVGIVSYGIIGGTSAQEQVGKSLSGVGLKVVPTKVGLAFHGNAGPDLFLAMNEGGLGEESRREWEGRKEEVVKMFEEVVEGLVVKEKKDGEPAAAVEGH